jgi:hypothetical protein
VIATEAKRGLGPLGVVRKGRSRTWIDDHGWWLINVEFQPSGHRQGCYLNVGIQHLWVMRDYLIFEDVERPLGGSHFIEFDGDAAAFGAAMQPAVTAAAAAVERRRVEHGNGNVALRRIAEAADDLNAGIALALLGDEPGARRRLTDHVHESEQETASGFVGLDAEQARERAWSAVQSARSALGLAAIDRPKWDA